MFPIRTPRWSANHLNLCLGVPEPLALAGFAEAAEGTRTLDLLHGKRRDAMPKLVRLGSAQARRTHQNVAIRYRRGRA